MIKENIKILFNNVDCLQKKLKWKILKYLDLKKVIEKKKKFQEKLL